MWLVSKIYEIGIYIYALSLLFFFSDCIRRNSSAKRMGTGLLIIVLASQVTVIAVRTWQDGMVPIITLYDFLFMFAFILVLTSLLMSFFQKSEITVLLFSLIGFCVLVLNHVRFDFDHNPLSNWESVHGLVVFHIVLANLSAVSFTIAAVFAAMYLFLHKKLKNKKWNDTMRRLPSLEMMDRLSYYGMFAGTPLLAMSLMVAILSIIAEERLELLLDFKVVSTFIGLGIFIYYFVKRRSNQNSGVTMSKWALIGYLFIIMNLLLNSWSDFHWWTGV